MRTDVIIAAYALIWVRRECLIRTRTASTRRNASSAAPASSATSSVPNMPQHQVDSQGVNSFSHLLTGRRGVLTPRPRRRRHPSCRWTNFLGSNPIPRTIVLGYGYPAKCNPSDVISHFSKFGVPIVFMWNSPFWSSIDKPYGGHRSDFRWSKRH